VHELRGWYIAETEGPKHARFSERAWFYGAFSNGEPITIEHRRLYRDRVDLQRAFPDPFDATAPGSSYCHWYKSDVMGQRVNVLDVEANPLVQFLQSKAPWWPNPLFDPEWYLAHYPDVASTGMNPLLHYVSFGTKEGRRPHARFDVDFYRQQLPPEQSGVNPLVHYFCHGIQQHLRTSPLYDPDLDAPLRRMLVRWANARRPLILIISHYGGGGTERHVRDLVKASGPQARFLQLTPKPDGTVIVSGAGGDLRGTLTFDPRAQFE
jgi:hypothetical protein